MTITDKDQRVLLNLLKQKEKIEDAEILDQEALDKINAEIAMIDPSYLEAWLSDVEDIASESNTSETQDTIIPDEVVAEATEIDNLPEEEITQE